MQYDDWCSIVIHVALDNIIVTDEICKLLSFYIIVLPLIVFYYIVNLCEVDDNWKPLLLMVPLRLGLSEVNPIYVDSLKRCFHIPGMVGMIGGRPNQALYFIGYVADEALYLDPHTTQKHGTVGAKSEPTEFEMDETFHQKYVGRINFTQMDPSLALVWSFGYFYNINFFWFLNKCIL